MDYSLFLKLFEFYAYIIVGFIIGKIFNSKIEDIRKKVTDFLILLISPLQIIISLTTTEFPLTASFFLKIVLFSLILFGLFSIITFTLLTKRNEEPKTTGAMFLLISFPNAMFFNIPIILAFFTEELVIVVVIFSSVMLLIRGTVGVYYSEKFGTQTNLTFKDSLVRLIKFPPFLAIIIGWLILGFHLPYPSTVFLFIKPTINFLASGLSALLIGMILSLIKREAIQTYKEKIKWISLWRIGFSFIIFAPLLFFYTFPEQQTEIRTILLLVATSPPAVYNVVFSIYFKLDEHLAAASVATITLISLLLLPLMLIFGMTIY